MKVCNKIVKVCEKCNNREEPIALDLKSLWKFKEENE